MSVIYIQIIICASVAHMHTILPPPSTHRITSCTCAALHDPFCRVTLRLPLLVFVSCYPFIALHNVDTFLYFFFFLLVFT